MVLDSTVEDTYTASVTLCIEPLDGGPLQSVSVYEKGSDQFAARLRKVFKERRKWAKKQGIHCYRIYDADLPDYAAAIDMYECVRDDASLGVHAGNQFLHIAEYQAPKKIDEAKTQRRFEDIMTITPILCGVPEDNVFVKLRYRDKGGAQYADNRPSFRFASQEGSCLLEVDLNAYLDTGLFLDHRDTRAMVGKMAAGKRFLNLFSYTGTCTLQAAAGQATTTTTVDLSQTYLDWAQKNMALNGFVGPRHGFERADCMAWLLQAAKQQRRFDLVFVDPPTFSNSKSMQNTWDVQRDHVELLRRVRAVCTNDAQVVFSCNLRTFKLDFAAIEALGFDIKDISAKSIPHDFERNQKIHYCFLLQAKDV